MQFFGVCASLDLLGPRHVFAPGNRLLDIADDGPLNFIAASTSLRQYWSQFHISWHTFFLRRIFVPICVRGDFSQLAATTATMGFSAALHGASSPHWLFFAWRMKKWRMQKGGRIRSKKLGCCGKPRLSKQLQGCQQRVT